MDKELQNFKSKYWKHRTDYFKPPQYKNFLKKRYFEFFSKEYIGFCIVLGDNNIIGLDTIFQYGTLGYKPYYNLKNTEDNYLKLCDISLKLFYGELKLYDFIKHNLL